MQPLQLFALAADHGRWLAARQAVVAENVANANTPNYKASDLAPFSAPPGAAPIGLARTVAAHLTSGAAAGAPDFARMLSGGEASHSGNTVDLDREMLTAGEIGSAFALEAGIVKAFHRMLLASAKG